MLLFLIKFTCTILKYSITIKKNFGNFAKFLIEREIMINNLDQLEIDYVNGAAEKAGGGTPAKEIPEVVAEAVVGFVIGVLEAWTDDK